MQLVHRLGDVSYPAHQQTCDTSSGFNCTVSLAVTSVAASSSSAGATTFEALIVNHPTGPTRQPDYRHEADTTRLATGAETHAFDASVTIVFTGSKMPATVSIRRVDATHANVMPAYHAAGSPDYPNATLMAALAKASEIIVESVQPKQSSSKPGAWEIALQMPAYAVASVSFAG